jgi:prepilin-type N-terminal cleavage/methylation domain-containing protein
MPIATYSKTVKGFTLVEMLVSLFIFALIMVAVSQIFSTAFLSYRTTRSVQHDIENAQYTLGILAKELRTSSIVSASGSQQSVQFYDHSQSKCFQYRINANRLQFASIVPTPNTVAGCAATIFVGFTTISTGNVTGSFQVTTSETPGGPPVRVGKVTIALTIAEATTHQASIQTSISLRDFGNIGL